MSRRLLAGVPVLVVSACNLILDNDPGVLVDGGGFPTGVADPIGAGDDTSSRDACGPGAKPCGGVCVTMADPAFGCAADTCAPCELAHALANCVGGRCVVQSCADGWADCNADPRDGCEADLSSVATCGACGHTCPSRPHAAPRCDGVLCVLACDEGFADCNGDPADGCETDTRRDARHCGGCENRCFSSGKCRDGRCRWGP